MALELTDFALFLEVIQQGSFSRAAGVLRLAQPSVSARIAALERSVGLPLFARSARGVTLTAAGRALEPYARRCVALAEEGRLSARTTAGSQRLVMAAPPSLAAGIFPPLIAALAAEPLELDCRTAHSHEVVEQLVDGAVQVGFLLGAAVPDGITARRLYRLPIISVARRDHPAAVRTRRLNELDAYRLAIHSWGPGTDELAEMLRTVHLPLTRVCWVSPSTTALALAVEHGYIAMLPADTALAGLRSGVLSRVKITNLPQWSMDVAVAYRRGLGEEQAPKVIQVLTEAGGQIAAALSR
jgi:LysR family transcriptional regulator, pca operon transcriptional activator